MEDGTRRCKRCEEVLPLARFEPTRGGYRLKACKPCRGKTKTRGVPKPRPCQNCGETFQPKAYENVTYCSKSCAASVNVSAQWAAWRSAWESENVGAACPIPWRDCQECGQEFYRRPSGLYCGDDCRTRFAQRKAGYTPKGTEARRTCVECRQDFTYISATLPPKTCSDACKEVRRQAVSARAQALRKARMAKAIAAAGELVSPPDIYNRDRWVCQICHQPVEKRAKMPHPKAPTLDHIIPLSKGGPHTRENLRLAHFICNSRRGNREGGQLFLFG